MTTVLILTLTLVSCDYEGDAGSGGGKGYVSIVNNYSKTITSVKITTMGVIYEDGTTIAVDFTDGIANGGTKTFEATFGAFVGDTKHGTPIGIYVWLYAEGIKYTSWDVVIPDEGEAFVATEVKVGETTTVTLKADGTVSLTEPK